jgi:hypothetical protein
MDSDHRLAAAVSNNFIIVVLFMSPSQINTDTAPTLKVMWMTNEFIHDYIHSQCVIAAALVLILTCVSVVLHADESSLYTPAVTDSYVLESPDAANSK